MTTGFLRVRRCAHALILAITCLLAVNVAHSNLILASHEFSENDQMDKEENGLEAISLDSLPNNDKTANQKKYKNIKAQVVQNKTESIMPETYNTNDIKVTSMHTTESSEKPGESTLLSTSIEINDIQTSIYSNKSLESTTHSLIKSSTMENFPSTTELDTPGNFEKHISTDYTVGATEELLTSLTEVQLNNSEFQSNQDMRWSTTSAADSTNGISTKNTTTYPFLYNSTISSPPVADFLLISTFQGEPCMLATMAIQVIIQCRRSNNKMQNITMNVPKNANISGSCDKPQRMSLTWLDEFKSNVSLTLSTSPILPNSGFLKTVSEQIFITDVSLKMKIGAKALPGCIILGDTFSAWATNLSLFKSPVNRSYSCSKVPPVELKSLVSKMGPVTVTFSDVQFQAYAPTYYDAIDCKLSIGSKSNTGALTIGGTMGLLGIHVVFYVLIYWRIRLQSKHEFNALLS